MAGQPRQEINVYLVAHGGNILLTIIIIINTRKRNRVKVKFMAPVGGRGFMY